MSLFFGDAPLLKMFIEAGAETENIRLGVFAMSMSMGHTEACQLAFASSSQRASLVAKGTSGVLH